MMNHKKLIPSCLVLASLFGSVIAKWRNIDDYTDFCDQNANGVNGKTNREVCEEMNQFCVAYNVSSTWGDDFDDQPFDDEVAFRCQLAVKCKNDNDCAGHSYQGSGELKCIKDYKHKWTYFTVDDNELSWKASTGQCGVSSRAIFQNGCEQERVSSSAGRRLNRGKPAKLIYNNFADFSAYDCNHVEENNKTIEENCASIGKACMNMSFTQMPPVDDGDDLEFPGQRHFKSALCEVPLYYCDEYDCESMGYVCSGNYSRWDDDDWMARYDRPFCVEELTRKGYTSSSRTQNRTVTRLAVPLNCEGAPTAAPTQTMTPTMVPIPAPTSAPTKAPKKANLIDNELSGGLLAIAIVLLAVWFLAWLWYVALPSANQNKVQV